MLSHGSFSGGSELEAFQFWRSSLGYVQLGIDPGRIERLLRSATSIRLELHEHLIHAETSAPNTISNDPEAHEYDLSDGNQMEDLGEDWHVSTVTANTRHATANTRHPSTVTPNTVVIRARRRLRIQDLKGRLCSISNTLIEYIDDDSRFSVKAYGLHSTLNSMLIGVAWSPFKNCFSESNGRVVGILIRTSKRPWKAVCLSFRLSGLSVNFTPESDEMTLLRRCSCLEPCLWSPLRINCVHEDEVCDSETERSIKSLLFLLATRDREREHSEHEREDYSLFVYSLFSSSSGMSTKRRKTFYISFDMETLVAMPVLQRRNGTLQCFGCEVTRGSKNTCQHIAVCDMARIETRSDIIETETEEPSQRAPDLVPRPEQYCSFRNRRLLMCPSERAALKAILKRIANEEGNLLFSDPAEQLRCPFEQDFDVDHSVDVSFTMRRETVLHTLLHGDVPVSVVDYKCSCGKMVWFDGSWVGLFSASRDHVYTKDILEALLMSTCVNDTSFREAYAALQHIRLSAAASLIIEGCKMDCRSPQAHLGIQRRAANDAFNNFLHCVNGSYLSGDHTPLLDKLHTCKTCEVCLPTEFGDHHRGPGGEPPVRTNEGRRRFRGIVVDGTATGILSVLPPYIRHELEIGHIPNVPRRFIIAEDGRNRVQKDAILRLITAAKKSCSSCSEGIGCPNFRVVFKGASFDLQRAFLVDIFPSAQSPDNTSEGMNDTVVHLLTAAYTTRAHTAPNCSLEERGGRDIILSHKLDRKVRSCVSDIIQLCLTDSVAGVFIVVEEDISAYEAYGSALRHLQLCNCGAGTPSANNGVDTSGVGGDLHSGGGPYPQCLVTAFEKGAILRDKTPSLAELTVTMCEIILNRTGQQRQLLLTLCRAVADAVETATMICAEYFQKCNENLPQAASDLQDSLLWESNQEIWQGSVPSAQDLRNLSSLESGCLFPGRYQCRPLIKFKENSDQQRFCEKNYRTSKSHSPGLLTAQCVCQHPKIIGVIVMTQNESTALALSSVLSFFETLPETTYYDNGCNLRRGIVSRIPFIFHHTKLLIDRFHFKSHICSSVFDPTAYPELTYQRTTTAESLNSVLAETRKHVRFLSGSNLIPFLRARMVIMNMAANIREQRRVSDIEDCDLVRFFDELVPCNCMGELCSSSATSVLLETELDVIGLQPHEDHLLPSSSSSSSALESAVGMVDGSNEQ